MITRRNFLGSASAAVFVTGCRTAEWFGTPELRFGVVSDIHVTTPESTRMFRRALRYFRSRGADAVMVPGDLTDWGLKSGYRFVADAWKDEMSGSGAVPLFCTGNHDFDGWWYGDMTMEMHANGYSETDRNLIGGQAKSWRDAFGEEYAPCRLRTVKGYHFVSSEHRGAEGLGEFMRANAAKLRNGKPFFYFQHGPIAGTTSDSGEWNDRSIAYRALRDFPNAVSFTGHCHRPFCDERSLWQGDFTAVAVPSLSYACTPRDHENDSSKRGQKWGAVSMPFPTSRRDLRGGEGYFVSVYADRLVIERIDIEEDGREGAPAWIVPLERDPSLSNRARAAASVAPRFPAGAVVDTETRNTVNRLNDWSIVMNCEFPSAVVPEGARVFDYELRVIADGREALRKLFLSPAYPFGPWREPARQRFWFDVKDLPQGGEYHIEVRASNCWGKWSEPIRSKTWKPLPGLSRVNRMDVMLTFDDGAKGHLTTAAPILEKYGFRGVFNIVTSWIGRPKHLTWDDVRELKRRGHEIATHTHTHPNMVKLFEEKGDEAVLKELAESRDILGKELGERPTLFCPPYIAYNDAVEAISEKAGMKLMFGPRMNNGTGMTAAAFSETLRKKIDGGTRYLDLLFHGVEPTSGWAPLAEGEFEGIIRELRKLVDEGYVNADSGVNYCEWFRNWK